MDRRNGWPGVSFERALQCVKESRALSPAQVRPGQVATTVLAQHRLTGRNQGILLYIVMQWQLRNNGDGTCTRTLHQTRSKAGFAGQLVSLQHPINGIQSEAHCAYPNPDFPACNMLL